MDIKLELLNTDLVIDNEWLDLYIDLIVSNIDTPLVRYETQRHHIIPVFYFEANGKEIDSTSNNLVNLYIRDHILAHYYLCRCTTKKYFGKSFAGINYILINQQINNLPELEDFIKTLDNIEEYYKE